MTPGVSSARVEGEKEGCELLPWLGRQAYAPERVECVTSCGGLSCRPRCAPPPPPRSPPQVTKMRAEVMIAIKDVNEVDKIRDEYEEQMDAVNEITDVLSTPWAAGGVPDEDELLEGDEE